MTGFTSGSVTWCRLSPHKWNFLISVSGWCATWQFLYYSRGMWNNVEANMSKQCTVAFNCSTVAKTLPGKYMRQIKSCFMQLIEVCYSQTCQVSYIKHESHVFQCHLILLQLYSTKTAVFHALAISAGSCRCGQASHALCVRASCMPLKIIVRDCRSPKGSS